MRKTLFGIRGKTSSYGPERTRFTPLQAMRGSSSTAELLSFQSGVSLLLESLDFLVVESPVISLGYFTQIDILRHVAAFWIDGYWAARADPFHAFDCFDRFLGIFFAAGRFDHLVYDMHAVIRANRREGKFDRIANSFPGFLYELLVLRRVMGNRIVERRQHAESIL